MGTGGLVVFRSVTRGKKEIYLKARFHADGDYSSLGFRLHRFLSGVEFTNGLSGLESLEAILMNPDLQAFFPEDKVEEVREHRRQKMKAFKTVCNGFDCLVAQFVAQFKYGPGGLYILPLSSPLVCEFVYVIDQHADAPQTSECNNLAGLCWRRGQNLQFGRVPEFVPRTGGWRRTAAFEDEKDGEIACDCIWRCCLQTARCKRTTCWFITSCCGPASPSAKTKELIQKIHSDWQCGTFWFAFCFWQSIQVTARQSEPNHQGPWGWSLHYTCHRGRPRHEHAWWVHMDSMSLLFRLKSWSDNTIRPLWFFGCGTPSKVR